MPTMQMELTVQDADRLRLAADILQERGLTIAVPQLAALLGITPPLVPQETMESQLAAAMHIVGETLATEIESWVDDETAAEVGHRAERRLLNDTYRRLAALVRARLAESPSALHHRNALLEKAASDIRAQLAAADQLAAAVAEAQPFLREMPHELHCDCRQACRLERMTAFYRQTRETR